MRLQPNQTAPAFVQPDLLGENFDLNRSRDKPLLLAFFRYASCPLYNLRVHELIENYSRLKDQFEIVAVFQSPAVKIEQYVGQKEIPFRVIPDPDKKLYQLYGVESSWLGFGKAWTVKIGRVFNAVIRHHFIPGSMEGEIHRIPADFIITPNNTILEAYYGEDIGDHLPLQQIEDLLHNHEAK